MDFTLYLVQLFAISFVASVAADKRQDTRVSDILYKQFHIDSLIVSRYAVTTITSVVRNDDPDDSEELEFRVQLPEKAFISNFSMSVDGRTYYGVAKEKESAAQEFEERISAGENAGLVESRGTEVFSVRINTAANSEATFVLQYEELIVRRRSKYQQVLNLNPGAVVDDFEVQVRVVDTQDIVDETAPQFATSERVSGNEVVFSYRPSAEEQQEDSEYGLGRDLTVEYDVVHFPNSTGTFVVDNNCYFAQFFTPTGVGSVPVDLVFVIDVSGSMGGNKIQQTREALETIINQLRASDRFTMLTFSDAVSYWRETLVSASEYRQQGIQFAQSLQAGGGTNFHDGLIDGASVLKTHARSEHVPLLVILTDGQPTSGLTNEDTIVKNAGLALAGTAISLNCLGFGNNLNYRLLERLALQNNGKVRRIYEGQDAAQQLEGFFDEISSPLLRNIQITFDSGTVHSVSSTEFPLFFDGGEIVVAGQCDKDASVIDVEVAATGEDGPVMFTSEVSTNPTSIVGDYLPSTERLLAYLLIQQLLESRLALTDEEAINANVERALELSLEYNFVTELTSLIVVEESGGSGSGAGNESLIGGDGSRGDLDEEDGDSSFHPATALPATAPVPPASAPSAVDSDDGETLAESSAAYNVPIFGAVLLLHAIGLNL